MKLSDEQVDAYNEQGFLLLENLFSPEEIDTLENEIRSIAREDRPGRVFEAHSETVRALHGCQLHSDLCMNLCLQNRLVEPATQILGEQVYVHQFKVNTKAPFRGKVWPWHQDFIFWTKLDGVPRPELVNVCLFLSDNDEFNGPLFLIPQSHTSGMWDVAAADNGSGWQQSFSADLTYTVPHEVVTDMERQHGLFSAKAPAGSVLIFHPNLIHGSTPNISPRARSLLLITYNSIANTPVAQGERRPEFLVSRDYAPLNDRMIDSLNSESRH
jgi:ectoine hydroxylase